jgi:hypothetical protein
MQSPGNPQKLPDRRAVLHKQRVRQDHKSLGSQHRCGFIARGSDYDLRAFAADLTDESPGGRSFS